MRHELKVVVNHALATALIGFCWAAVSDAAHAESNTASQHAALRNACTAQGGRFEQSWAYNDQGVQWGRVLSCSTSAGYITCQGDVCRGIRWDRPDGVTAADIGPNDSDGAAQFPAEPVAFSAALAALSGK